MEAYATVLSYAIPGFVVLIIIEHFVGLGMGKKVNRPMDTISSLSSGMTNTLKEMLGIAVVIVSYSWMVGHLALFTITSTLWLYLLCFVLVDFASYWSHRFNHEINVMWNRHIVHHSSEEFNLSCALRQSISGIIGVYFFLYIPMALIGIPTKIVAVVAPLHLFAQFWYHTRLIDRMGWLEYLIVTPSHHRVHHAINPEYIDKNYAAIFIVWDKMFGTFQKEDPEIPPVYGVKKPVKTWNPFIINYQHLYLLAKDSFRTKSWIDKVKLWFMPTGWRPVDVRENYPINVIENVFDFEKYDPAHSRELMWWSWFQLIFANVLMYFLLVNIADISMTGIIVFSVFLSLTIFSYTSLMDGHAVSILVEVIKFFFGLYIFFSFQWFGIDDVFSGASMIMTLYIVLSLGLTFYFYTQKPRIEVLSDYQKATATTLP